MGDSLCKGPGAVVTGCKEQRETVWPKRVAGDYGRVICKRRRFDSNHDRKVWNDLVRRVRYLVERRSWFPPQSSNPRFSQCGPASPGTLQPPTPDLTDQTPWGRGCSALCVLSSPPGDKDATRCGTPALVETRPTLATW